MSASFEEALGACVAAIPRGRVATCGTIARALGDVRAARAVAAWLLERGGGPAHRVVRADGRPLLPDAAHMLRAEGVPMQDGRVDAGSFAADLPGPPIFEVLRREQQRLAREVSERDEPHPARSVGGVDVSYAGDRAFAVAVRLDAMTLETIEISEQEVRAEFPYVPTYLAYREFPAVRAAIEGLRERPDLLFVDGHGRLHPARFGFACFVGVRLDMPTVGIAKHALEGRPLPSRRTESGAVPLQVGGTVLGYAWAPPGAVRPFYISVGHRITLASALAAARRATKGRYPEPLVLADRKSKERRDEKNAKGSASGRTTRTRPPAQGREGV